jgi:hypothetical protein
MKPNEREILSPCLELLDVLIHFSRLKREKWEQIEDSIQMSNRLGIPSEDWIIPPDEGKTLAYLNEDPDYVSLRASITRLLPQAKKAAATAGFDLGHTLDWIRFTDPLIGEAALDDAIKKLNLIKQG